METDWQAVSSSYHVSQFYISCNKHIYIFFNMPHAWWPWDLGLQLIIPELKLHSLRLPTSDVNGFGPSPNIGTIAFDSHIELLWVGDCHVSLDLLPRARKMTDPVIWYEGPYHFLRWSSA